MCRACLYNGSRFKSITFKLQKDIEQQVRGQCNQLIEHEHLPSAHVNRAQAKGECSICHHDIYDPSATIHRRTRHAVLTGT